MHLFESPAVTAEPSQEELIDLIERMKRLTPDNWQLHDPHHEFGNLDAADWLRRVQTPTLSPTVPHELRQLFEIAQNSIAYGWYYQPVMTLAAEQLFRICERAAALRCEHSNIKTKNETFAAKIEALVAAGIIPQADIDPWKATRFFRNYRSHPKGTMLIDHNCALIYLGRTSELINSLFK